MDSAREKNESAENTPRLDLNMGSKSIDFAIDFQWILLGGRNESAENTPRLDLSMGSKVC